MNFDTQPDYKKYSLTELYDVKKNIDKGRYPDRYQQVVDEIELKKQNPETEKLDVNKFSHKDKVLAFKIIMAFFSFLFLIKVFNAMSTGVTSYRGNYDVYLSSNPGGFYCGFRVFFLFILSVYHI